MILRVKMKYYHMIIEPVAYLPDTKEAKESRKEYISTHQGAAPIGWRCVGVCGYHENTNNSVGER